MQIVYQITGVIKMISIEPREDLDGKHVLVFSEEEDAFYLEKPDDRLMSSQSFLTKEQAMQAILRDSVIWIETK